MRRQHFNWTYLVISILLIMYGGINVFRFFNKNNTMFYISLAALAIGVIMLIAYVVLSNIKTQKQIVKSEDIYEEEQIESEEEVIAKITSETNNRPSTYNDSPSRSSDYKPVSSSQYDFSAYVKRVGYGPVLDIRGNRIRDMRTNTYYRIENKNVYIEGSGLVYEIVGNSIKHAFGGYLYEKSGDNINKVFGGYFASISGNYLKKYDLSEEYEITDRLTTTQLLVVVVLLFGE